MKKYLLIMGVLILSIFNIVGVLTQSTAANNMENRGCQSLSGCSGTAICNSPGGVSGCNIACDNGAQIFCPRA